MENSQGFYVLDNLIINGFLTVGNDLLPNQANFGDVLVQNQFLLSENSALYFCKDERQAQTNTSLNKDCATKILIWHPDGVRPDGTPMSDNLEIVDPAFYQIQANSISGTEIGFQAIDDMDLSTEVNLSGCFNNDASGDCAAGELKTKALFVDRLIGFPKPNIDPNINRDEIILNPTNLIFDKIVFDKDYNIDDQYLCWGATRTTASDWSCPAGRTGQKTEWDFVSHGTTYHPDTMGGGAKLCCYLNVTF